MQSAKKRPKVPKSERARARFFVRVGAQHHKHLPKDTETLPLFPLVLLMQAEGLLAADVKV